MIMNTNGNKLVGIVDKIEDMASPSTRHNIFQEFLLQSLLDFGYITLDIVSTLLGNLHPDRFLGHFVQILEVLVFGDLRLQGV
jgi:hypothetical protein